MSHNLEQVRQLNAQAATCIEREQLEQAEALLKQAIEADDGFGPAHNNLGIVYVRQNRLYEAAWQFQYAAKLMPGRAEPTNNLGLVFERARKFDDAIKSYETAHKLAPNDVRVIGNLARAKTRRGDRDAELGDLLHQVLMKDTRSDWRHWAREQLALNPGQFAPGIPGTPGIPRAPETQPTTLPTARERKP